MVEAGRAAEGDEGLSAAYAAACVRRSVSPHAPHAAVLEGFPGSLSPVVARLADWRGGAAALALATPVGGSNPSPAQLGALLDALVGEGGDGRCAAPRPVYWLLDVSGCRLPAGWLDDLILSPEGLPDPSSWMLESLALDRCSISASDLCALCDWSSARALRRLERLSLAGNDFCANEGAEEGDDGGKERGVDSDPGHPGVDPAGAEARAQPGADGRLWRIPLAISALVRLAPLSVLDLAGARLPPQVAIATVRQAAKSAACENGREAQLRCLRIGVDVLRSAWFGKGATVGAKAAPELEVARSWGRKLGEALKSCSGIVRIEIDASPSDATQDNRVPRKAAIDAAENARSSNLRAVGGVGDDEESVVRDGQGRAEDACDNSSPNAGWFGSARAAFLSSVVEVCAGRVVSAETLGEGKGETRANDSSSAGSPLAVLRSACDSRSRALALFADRVVFQGGESYSEAASLALLSFAAAFPPSPPEHRLPPPATPARVADDKNRSGDPLFSESEDEDAAYDRLVGAGRTGAAQDGSDGTGRGHGVLAPGRLVGSVLSGERPTVAMPPRPPSRPRREDGRARRELGDPSHGRDALYDRQPSHLERYSRRSDIPSGRQRNPRSDVGAFKSARAPADGRAVLSNRPSRLGPQRDVEQWHRRGGAGDTLPDFGRDLDERDDVVPIDVSDEEADRSDSRGQRSGRGSGRSRSKRDSSSGSSDTSSSQASSSSSASEEDEAPLGSSRSRSGRGHHAPVAHSGRPAEPFRLPDGELDDDDVAARRWARHVPALARSLRDPERRRRALRAFRMWHDMASDPWDRRRWINPRLDRKDSPELLGLLNLLYDLLEEEGKYLDFPFPIRKPGKGQRAFIECAHQDEASDEEEEATRDRARGTARGAEGIERNPPCHDSARSSAEDVRSPGLSDAFDDATAVSRSSPSSAASSPPAATKRGEGRDAATGLDDGTTGDRTRRRRTVLEDDSD